MKRILLIEDSKKTQQLILHSLEREFEVFIAETASETLHYCRSQNPDLILLDINLGIDSGYTILEQLKVNRLIDETPVIFLTGEESIQNKVIAFNLGADDYITKPFDPTELNLRIKARLKDHGSRDSKTISFQGINIDTNTLTAYELNEQGKRENLDLYPTEIKLLVFFIENKNQVFSREQIFHKVWGDNCYYLDRTIDRHISSLRKKIGKWGDCIRTIYGAGYMWDTAHYTSSFKAS